MPVSIYPPILQSSQPAFLYTESSYAINFTLQKITQFNEIGHVQIRIVKQSNNKTIANIAKYPDGTIYKPPSQIETNNNNYFVSILSTDLGELWKPGVLYKVQMRFGINEMFNSVSEFATWKQQQIEQPNGAFSEWSTVMIIKAINKPYVYIQNAEAVNSTDLVYSERTEPTLTPLFFGICDISIGDKEVVDKFKFDLYKGEKNLSDFTVSPFDDLIESSGWIQHNASISVADQYRFSVALTNDEEYTVFYSIQTTNGYYGVAEPYVFLATRTYLSEMEDVNLTVDSKTEYCKENGCIRLLLDSKSQLSGSYVITRSSEKTNYQLWEDLQYLTFFAKKFNKTLVYTDFTIESGIKYKYAIQQENAAGLRTSPLYDENNTEHYIDFEYSYLYHNGIQLRLMFNHKINTFKHTVLTSKQDTLGSKYPHLVKNGYAYYAEFPISGLVSFQMDPDRTFLRVENDSFFYEDEKIIPQDKFDLSKQNFKRQPCQDIPHDKDNVIPIDDGLNINKDLTDNNIFIERKFREKVEQFLTDFKYKLYKSPTEGNIIIALQNVSFTPNTTLGRMIYDFSATAYEVLENTLENLNQSDIINIDEFHTLASNETIYNFGQIQGIYTTPQNPTVDVYSLIKRQEEVSVGGGYKLQVKRLHSIWVERYPNSEITLNNIYENENIIDKQIRKRIILSAELAQLEALYAKIKNEQGTPEEIAAIEKQIQNYQSLQNAAISQQEESNIIIEINGKSIMISPHKIYGIEYPISNLKVISSDYPIIINYVCELNQVEDQSQGVITAIDATRIWGQISGVFTDTNSIIKESYNYSFIPNVPPYRVFSNYPGIIYDENGNLVVDSTNFNLYKTTNIYEIIKEESRKQVETLYGITEGFTQNAAGEWVSGSIIYNFSGITAFEIEAEQGTELEIGKSEDGSDAITIKIGPNKRYSLQPMENLIRYIKLKNPSFAIINYKCLTSQMRIKR